MSVRLKFRESAKPDKEGTLYYQIIHERETRRVGSRHRIYGCEWDDSIDCIVIPEPDTPRRNILMQIAKY